MREEKHRTLPERVWKVRLIYFFLLHQSRAHSLTDRMTGFGPVGGGSIPPGLVQGKQLSEKYGAS